MSAAYSGPLPGTLCEDGSCRQVPPGAYTAPASRLLRTYTQTQTRSCPAGYTGSVTVRETWQDWRVWSPDVVGVSSRGTAGFTSRVESRLVDTQRTEDCQPGGGGGSSPPSVARIYEWSAPKWVLIATYSGPDPFEYWAMNFDPSKTVLCLPSYSSCP